MASGMRLELRGRVQPPRELVDQPDHRGPKRRLNKPDCERLLTEDRLADRQK